MLVLALGDLHIPLRTHDLPSKFKKLLVPGKIQQIVCTGNVCDRETWEYLRGVAPDVRGVRGEYDENPALPPSLVLQHGALRIGVIHGHQVVPLGDTEALCAVARKMDVDVLISGATHRFEAFEYDSRFFVNPGSATGAFSPLWTAPPPPPPAAASEVAPASTTPAPPTTASSPPPSTADATPSSPSQSTNGNEPSSPPTSTSVDDNDITSNEPTSPDTTPAEPATTPSAPPTTTTPETATTPMPSKPRSTFPPSPTPSFALLDIQGTVVTLYVYQLVEGEVKVEKISFRKPTQL